MKEFTHWAKWQDRNSLPDLKDPGVYVIALSDHDLAGKSFSWCSKKIVYIGMTNSKDGLKSRLQRFEYTIIGKNGHGGALRVRFKHSVYDTLVPKLFVSVCSYNCDVTSNAPEDFRIMGDVAKFEYECFAVFTEHFGQLPEFNDKKRSPKK